MKVTVCEITENATFCLTQPQNINNPRYCTFARGIHRWIPSQRDSDAEKVFKSWLAFCESDIFPIYTIAALYAISHSNISCFIETKFILTKS